MIVSMLHSMLSTTLGWAEKHPPVFGDKHPHVGDEHRHVCVGEHKGNGLNFPAALCCKIKVFIKITKSCK